jgi:PAS domain S-box-containing protein
VFETVLELVRKDGVHILVRSIGKAVDPQDLSKGTLWLMEDVTERKVAEDALRQSEEKYRAMIEAFDGYMYICSQGFRIEFMNDKLIQRTGRNATGEYCYKALHDLDAVCEWCVNEQVFAGKSVRWEVKSPKDGRWYEVNNLPVYNANGTISKQALIADITDRMRLEEVLRESEERFRLLVEHAPDAIFIQTDGLFSYVNQTSLALFGAQDEDDLLGNPVMERIHPDYHDAVRERIKSIKSELQSASVLAEQYLILDGTAVDVEVSAVPFDYKGEQGALVFVRDITERKQADEKLQKKNAEIEQFIYTVSHDLRSPLVTVKTFLGFLEDDMVGSNQERVTQDLQFLHSAADKMKMLLDELLELSRIDRIETESVKVSLSEVLTEVLDALAGVIAERKVDIRRPDTDLILFGDRPRLSQIWQNLIENAIKYSRDDSIPRIELGVQLMSGETVFFVKDNGIGIAPEYHAKIFGIFEKLDQKSPGAGMGLSMIQRIVEKCGGRIWVESNGDGIGSCFKFTQPGALYQ